jgi:DNA-binding HxlR family transcriptional regulator
MAKPRCGWVLRKDGERICPVLAASKLLRSMWSLVIISYLLDGPKSFNELLRTVPGINSKTLSRTLKSLQQTGLVSREIVSTQPFTVRYSLTEIAMDLRPLLEYLRDWGEKWAIRRENNMSPNLITGEEKVGESDIASMWAKRSDGKNLD